MAQDATKEAEYLVNHIFLPPGLPQERDGALELTLAHTTEQALSAFQQYVPAQYHSHVQSARDALRQVQILHHEFHTGVSVGETALRAALEKMAQGGCPLIILNISSQNAGLLLWKENNSAIFAPFELSPTNKSVMSTKGRLVRSFPASAVAIPLILLEEPRFRQTLAQTISKMSSQLVSDMVPKVRKNGELLDEDRDTVHPGLVSELLMGFLKANGAAAKVLAITKNTRDEILWQHARSPWRRSPMWLLIRVALQHHFARMHADGNHLYKSFMAFLLSHVSNEVVRAQASSLSTERVYCMNAKLLRRLQKLGAFPTLSDFSKLTKHLKIHVRNMALHLDSRWTQVQTNDIRTVDLTSLANSDFLNDSLIALPELDRYLATLSARRREAQAANFSPTLKLATYVPWTLPKLGFVHRDPNYAAANLQGFEQWIATSLDAWAQTHRDDPDICEVLGALLKAYHSAAKACYGSNPEAISIMVLHVTELWVACDTIACGKCPLLHDYQPGVMFATLRSLLLPHAQHMERLHKAEKYLAERERSPRPSALLFATNVSEAFAATFFDQSHKHQTDLSHLKDQVRKDKAQKLEELALLKAEYASLRTLAADQDHSYKTEVIDSWCDPPETRQVHTSSCLKCSYERQMGSMRIDAYEDAVPMEPRRANKAKAIVFELDVPATFAHWRDTRLYFLTEVLQHKLEGLKPERTYSLSSDRNLYASRSSNSQSLRIGLSSEVKSNIIAHRRDEPVATATNGTACRPNGSDYEYYDFSSGTAMVDLKPTEKLAETCTYKLPHSAKALQKYIARPSNMCDGPSPNMVIANQHECPSDMALDEYKELCTIPLGHRIQWQNILLQLHMPGVDFKKLETTFFVLQCMYQAGPTGPTGHRSSHQEFQDTRLAAAIVDSLGIALGRVRSNWQSAQALGTFIAIGSRVLSLSDDAAVQKACLVFLAEARNVTFKWINLLRDKAHQAEDNSNSTMFMSKSVEISLICASSFDVEGSHLDTILSSSANVSIMIQCSIAVHEGKRTVKHSEGSRISQLAHNFSRLLHRSFELLASCQAGLDDAVCKSWSAYQPGNGWIPASHDIRYWITTSTMITAGAQSMSVQYNLLTGELLVNGLPLDRPPSTYESQQLYSTLFGKAAVEVMPASAPGMQFSTKRKFEGFAVNMGFRQDATNPSSALVVQALRGHQKFETVAVEYVIGMFPDHFTSDHVLWYDFSKHIVQFRPRKDPWNATSSSTWNLARSSTCNKWHLKKEGSRVLGRRSATTQNLSAILKPLTSDWRIHCILDPSGTRLSVDIPTLHLSFTLEQKSSALLSREYRGMQVDCSQALGTLVGMQNKLLLKPTNGGDRILLLPEAPVVHRKTALHTSVKIVNTDHILGVHPIRVDTRLGRLVDNGSQACKLQLAYLHALTSFCLPDPLTSKTGTEQALDILASASLRSFAKVSQQDCTMLGLIASLSPGRQYYPRNLQDMQTIIWDRQLPCLAQHGRFFDLVHSIFDQARQYGVFYPNELPTPPSKDCIDTELHERDAIRAASFRIADYGAEKHNTNHDRVYDGRGASQTSKRALYAYAISTMIQDTDVVLRWPRSKRGLLWRIINKEIPTVFGPSASVKSSELQYDGAYIADWKSFMLANLPGIHRILTSSSSAYGLKFDVMMWLSTLAWAEDVDLGAVQLLALIYVTACGSRSALMPVERFSPAHGKEAKRGEVKAIIERHVREFEACPESNIDRHVNERLWAYNERRQQLYRTNKDAAVENFTTALMSQWPCEKPFTPSCAASIEVYTYIDIHGAIVPITQSFKTWYQNSLLFDWLLSVEDRSFAPAIVDAKSPNAYLDITRAPSSRQGYITVQDLFAGPAPLASLAGHLTGITLITGKEAAPADNSMPSRLSRLIADVGNCKSSSRFEAAYIDELESSHRALHEQINSNILEHAVDNDTLSQHVQQCAGVVQATYNTLANVVTTISEIENSHQLPRICPTFFLRQLTQDRWRALSKEWKQCIITYGLALVSLQRAERMHKLFNIAGTVTPDLVNEMQNAGHENWDPMEYPESLLMEVESAITIRKVQEKIASEMRKPSTNLNSVMQLNMGEGKSSVIVPIVAAALANGKQLVRVIVGKPQSKQMAQMLISKLGGMLNRRVYYMPFSRSLRLSVASADVVAAIYRECMETGGILLVQPEHILSFKLMAPECYISGSKEVGKSLLSTQDFFNASSRDLVDESDENFSVHFELIYTMGSQRPIEMSPDRWLLIQEVLGVIKTLIPSIVRDSSGSIESHDAFSGGFPRTRILRADAEARLVGDLARHICRYGLSGFPIARQPKHIRDAVFVYMTKFELTKTEVDSVEQSGPNGFWAESTRSALLLLRGLLAGGVLAFVFGKKRWRVNFGTAVRTPPTRLAVPYRAKDNPSPRSEFSHPDVVVVLTQLCYYYSGLTNGDLFIALQHLIDSDQADIEYQMWVKDAKNLPPAFAQLQGINLKDKPQCITTLFPSLRHGKSVVDYFLAHIVFPKEMKEFPHKLSASGWDIGMVKQNPTTGFSGTCDSKALLPLSVNHLDLPEQKHTNALVLEHLLQPQNSVHLMPLVKDPSVSDADRLLNVVLSLKPEVHVILDVGAQILELDNIQVATKWLKMHPDPNKEAVVFVNESDEIFVIDRPGRIELLQTSSYASRLDACLIFLDEAHTRGIDLKLPTHYRAAVTLGANLTKDRLVQACMRMRKLGKGQTVVFCISEEIQTKILERTKQPAAAEITVTDVLHWAISETFTESRHCMPLWTVQGQRFVTQEKLWKQFTHGAQTALTQEHAEEFLEEEAQSLDDRYRPRTDNGALMLAQMADSIDPDIQRIVDRCRQFDDLSFNASTLQEEQERELSPEIEQERQVQRPSPATPAKHVLHPDVIAFAMTGIVVSRSKAYISAFKSLDKTSAAKDLGFPIEQLTGKGAFLITMDGARTIEKSGKSFVSDQYQRHVQWILTNANKGTVTCAMILSPYEAERLYSIVRTAKSTTLRLYKARCNQGFAALDQLDLSTIPHRPTMPIVPRSLSVQLQIFAGQLYITSYDDYLEICKFLGLSTEAAQEGWEVAADGFIVKDAKGRCGGGSGLRQSPVQFLKVFMSKVRRNGESISKTQIGKILEGGLLQQKDFEDEEATVDREAYDSAMDTECD